MTPTPPVQPTDCEACRGNVLGGKNCLRCAPRLRQGPRRGRCAMNPCQFTALVWSDWLEEFRRVDAPDQCWSGVPAEESDPYLFELMSEGTMPATWLRCTP